MVSEKKMFENVDGRTDGRTTDGRTTDGRTTDAGVTGILIAHLGAFGSGELKRVWRISIARVMQLCNSHFMVFATWWIEQYKCETNSSVSLQCILLILCKYVRHIEDVHEEVLWWQNNFWYIYSILTWPIFVHCTYWLMADSTNFVKSTPPRAFSVFF